MEAGGSFGLAAICVPSPKLFSNGSPLVRDPLCGADPALQILLSDPSYDHEEEVDRGGLLAELRSQLCLVADNAELRESDIGRGASDPVIVALLLWQAFQIAKPIDENLDAWINLAKRFSNFLKWALGKGFRRRVDERGASLIATKAILDRIDGGVRSIKLCSAVYIPFWTDNGFPPDQIEHSPDGLFAQTYLVNGDRVFAFVIKSNGSIETVSEHPVLEWHRFE